MTNYYIKVVHADLEWGSLPVFTSQIAESEYRLCYVPNAWTRPHLAGSRLFLFRNLKAAFDYLATKDTWYRKPTELPYHGDMLWWCLAQGVERPQQLPLRGLSDAQIREYWMAYPFHMEDTARRRFGFGTSDVLFASAIQLVHVVSDEEIERLVKVGD